MMRLTSRPATLPASLVAWRWSSLKYAGTVMTALSTDSPRYASASVFSFWRIIALISGGEYCCPPASTRASPFGPLTTLNGTIVSSSFTSASLRPMKRLMEKTVFSGLVTACRLATVPTRRSPPLENATTDGVVRPPSAFHPIRDQSSRPVVGQRVRTVVRARVHPDPRAQREAPPQRVLEQRAAEP